MNVKRSDMPHLLLAALVAAGVWLAARAVRSLSAPQTVRRPVDHGPGDRSNPRSGERIPTLRQDPRTGIYHPRD